MKIYMHMHMGFTHMEMQKHRYIETNLEGPRLLCTQNSKHIDTVMHTCGH
eukprot:c41340_g1_i1 orf=26-175(+)